jgi:hypothetical protein
MRLSTTPPDPTTQVTPIARAVAPASLVLAPIGKTYSDLFRTEQIGLKGLAVA